MAKQRISIFSPTMEWLNLIFPLVLGAVCIGATLLGYSPSSHENELFDLISLHVFLNSSHVGFTFLMFLLLPQVREFGVLSVREMRLWPILVLILAVGLMAYGYMQSEGFYATNPQVSRINKYIALILHAITQHHVIAQVMGLSILYNVMDGDQSQLSEVQRSQLKKWHRMERWLFQVLLVLILIVNPVLGAVLGYKLTAFKYVYRVLALSILGVAWKIGKIAPSNKLIYLSRLLIWAFIPAAFYYHFIRSVHGMEYLFVTEKMMSSVNWYANPLKKWLFWIAALLGYPALYFFASYTSLLVPDLASATALMVIISIVLFWHYIHFYLDSVLFRFRDQDARRLVGPVLARQM